MSGLNKVILIGNLGKDPEIRYTEGGTAMLNFSMATSENYFTRDRERRERVDWHKIVVWGKRAEGLSKCLSKGSRIGLEGRIQTRSWENRDGNKKYVTEIIATNVILLGGGRREERHDEPTDDKLGPSAGNYKGDQFGNDENIPF